ADIHPRRSGRRTTRARRPPSRVVAGQGRGSTGTVHARTGGAEAPGRAHAQCGGAAMKVFLSWSGERSRAVAELLSAFLPRVLQAVDPFMSAHDIEPGASWVAALDAHLDAHTFGVLCLTPENLAAPWILFEAGALGKTGGESRVVPYRLSLS